MKSPPFLRVGGNDKVAPSAPAEGRHAAGGSGGEGARSVRKVKHPDHRREPMVRVIVR